MKEKLGRKWKRRSFGSAITYAVAGFLFASNLVGWPITQLEIAGYCALLVTWVYEANTYRIKAERWQNLYLDRFRPTITDLTCLLGENDDNE